MENLQLYIHGIKVQVISTDKVLMDFIKKSFPYFKNKSETKFDLEVNLNLNKKVNSHNKIKSLNKIGNGVYLSSDKLLLCTGLFIYEVLKKNNGLFLNIYTQKRNSFYGKFKQFIKQKILPTDYYNIVRQTIILPVIWILSRYLKIHALHGGTVQINGSALSFSGLSGIGKSILSLFCCLDKKNKLSKIIND